MTYKELDYIVNKFPSVVPNTKVGDRYIPDSGAPHPLWVCLHKNIRMGRQWSQLSGAEKGQIRRAADKLSEVHIPYTFYANYLSRMGKTWFIKNPLAVTKYNPKKSGSLSILGEYISLIIYLIKVFKECPNAIRLNDKVYSLLPNAYSQGPLKYVHTVMLIKECLLTHSINEVLTFLQNSSDITDFWNKLGSSAESTQKNRDFQIDLSSGKCPENNIKILQRELRIRLGKEDGVTNSSLDKYFKSSNRLNAQGLKVISGERKL